MRNKTIYQTAEYRVVKSRKNHRNTTKYRVLQVVSKAQRKDKSQPWRYIEYDTEECVKTFMNQQDAIGWVMFESMKGKQDDEAI